MSCKQMLDLQHTGASVEKSVVQLGRQKNAVHSLRATTMCMHAPPLWLHVAAEATVLHLCCRVSPRVPDRLGPHLALVVKRSWDVCVSVKDELVTLCIVL